MAHFRALPVSLSPRVEQSPRYLDLVIIEVTNWRSFPDTETTRSYGFGIIVYTPPSSISFSALRAISHSREDN